MRTPECIIYKSPQVEIVVIEMENGFSASDSNIEDPIEGEESDW